MLDLATGLYYTVFLFQSAFNRLCRISIFFITMLHLIDCWYRNRYQNKKSGLKAGNSFFRNPRNDQVWDLIKLITATNLL